MKSIESDALSVVNLSLRLSGPDALTTEFEDGRLIQTLDINKQARRGGTQAATSGFYTGVFRNIHSGAGDLSSSIAPYVTPVGARAPYPSPMGKEFEVWLIGAVVRQQAGTGTLAAVLSVAFGAAAQGWGIDDSGVAVATTMRHPIAFWDALTTVVIEFGLLNGARGPYSKIGLRLPRHDDTLIHFDTTASAAATFECQMILGVFPISLGQDVTT